MKENIVAPTFLKYPGIRDLCEGKTISEINSFQNDVKELRLLLDRLKVETRAIGAYLISGTQRILISSEVEVTNLSVVQNKAKKEALIKAREYLKEYFTLEPRLYPSKYKPLRLNYPFHIDNEEYRPELSQIDLFHLYPPFQEIIGHSPRSVFLLRIATRQSSAFDQVKYEIKNQVYEKTKQIFYKAYYVVNKMHQRRGFLIESEKEYFKTGVLKYDMERLLHAFLKILSDKINTLKRKYFFPNQ